MSDPRQPATPPQSPRRDPRDGAQPPAIPTDSPANPLALAALYSGNPAVTEAQIVGILGASVAVLLRDKASVLYLYGGKGKVPGATPAKRPAGAVERPGEVVVLMQGKNPPPGSPPKPPAANAKPPAAPANPPPGSPPKPTAVDWFLGELQRGGVGCVEWASMSETARLNTVRNFYYPVSIPQGGGVQPTKEQSKEQQREAQELVAAIDEACASAFTSAPAPAANEPRAVDWFVGELQRGGVGCALWASLSEQARLNTVRNFFYPVSVTQGAKEQFQARRRPKQPQELVAAIDEACQRGGTASNRVGAPTASNRVGAWAADMWARFARIGITCDQWFASGRSQQSAMIIALYRQNLLPFSPTSSWDEVIEALNRECLNRAEPASRSPTDSIRARVRAILDCAALDAQDKLQQITVILRAFPEFNNDREALYRLALARYDGCHAASEPGWAGQNFTLSFRAGTSSRSLASGPAWIQQTQQWGYNDVLEGDVAGMSLVQWVRQGPYMPPSGPDVFDPVQGATGDCYLIAAMAAVAWTQPNALAQLSQPNANGRRQFRLEGRQVEVSERTPCMILAGFAPLFARGSRLDAQWPGVLEKAFAVLASNDTTDRPDIVAALDNMFAPTDAIGTIRGSIRATSRSFNAIPAITGGSLFWHLTYFRSDDAVFDLLATYCTPDGRARVPMVASTYTSGGFVDRTELPASHVYTVLGYGFHADGRKFVVLRNPWGLSSTGLPAAGFTVPVVGRWLNRLSLNHGDGGCFALAHGAFAAAFNCFYGAQ